MSKKIMLIGKTGCGKTTLTQAILNKKIEYLKTQTVTYYDNIIDVPGEYIESRMFYSAIITTSVDAKIVLLLHDATDSQNSFPPNFASIFSKPTVGIVTKVEKDGANIKRSEMYLKNAGVGKILYLDSLSRKGLDSVLKEIN